MVQHSIEYDTSTSQKGCLFLNICFVQYSSLQENYVKVQGDVQNAQQSLSDIQEQLQEERDAHALLQIRLAS